MGAMPNHSTHIERTNVNLGQAAADPLAAFGAIILPPGAQIRGIGGVMKVAGVGTGTLTITLQKRGTTTPVSEGLVIDADAVAETDLGFADGVQNTSSTSAIAVDLAVTEQGTVSGDVTADLFILVEA